MSKTKKTETKSEVKKIETKEKPKKNIIHKIFNLLTLRHAVQIFFLLIINGYYLIGIFGQNQLLDLFERIRQVLPIWPILSSPYAPYSMFAGIFDVIEIELTTPIVPFLSFGILLLLITFTGRVGCGWICPFGMIQDFAGYLKKEKIRPSPRTEEGYREVKIYILMVVLILGAWVGIARATGISKGIIPALGPFADGPFSTLNPSNVLFVFIPDMISRGLFPTSLDTLNLMFDWTTLFWLQMFILVFILFLSVFIDRPFCRYLCPAGALMGIINKHSFIAIARNPAKCTPSVCNLCEQACPMGVKILDYPFDRVNDSECILCLKCKHVCPHDAIIIKFP